MWNIVFHIKILPWIIIGIMIMATFIKVVSTQRRNAPWTLIVACVSSTMEGLYQRERNKDNENHPGIGKQSKG